MEFDKLIIEEGSSARSELSRPPGPRRWHPCFPFAWRAYALM
jgi:hypothetical protein